SVLDAVLEDAKDLDRRLGGADHQKLDQYLSSVREMEKRIALSESLPPVEFPEPIMQHGTVQLPPIQFADLTEHYRLMSDLLVLAFQTDVTRIATYLMSRSGSEMKYTVLGFTEGHHAMTHHQNKPELVSRVAAINLYHVQQFVYMLTKMRS